MLSFMEHWTMIRGNHTMTFGFDYSRIRLEYPDTTALGGAFAFCPGNTSLNGGKAGTFANEFASFMLGVPCSENQSYFYQIPSFLQSQIFPYFGDKWVVNKKLTVNLGLRWEYYSPPTSHFAGGIANYLPSNNTIILNGIGGTSMSAGVQPDYRNWGPRVGLAYRLTNHDVLRAGFSMSSQPYPVDIYINNYQYPDVFNAAWSTLSSYGPVVLTDGTAGSFEKGFEPLVAPVIPSSGVIQVSSVPVLKSSTLYYADQHWRNPYIIAWNFAYERSLPGGWTLDVAYVGNRTPNSAIEYNLNAASVYGEGASGQPEYLSYGRTAATEDFFAQGRNAYDSLQVKTDHHFAQHVLFTSAYTWGKAIGFSEENSSYVSGLQDYVNLRRNYAPTDFNIASILSQSLVWDLPFGKGMPFFTTGVMNHVLGGWQLSGSWNAHTGFPLNFSASNPGFNTPGSNSYPNETGPFKVLHGINPNKWFDTSVFSTPAPGTQGNVGNYVDQGPGFFDLNAALSRTIRINERFKFQVRTEWLHATNTPEFSSPSLTVGSGSFGLVTSTIANTSRIIDVVGKLVF
jgi:hypothetical protein